MHWSRREHEKRRVLVLVSLLSLPLRNAAFDCPCSSFCFTYYFPSPGLFLLAPFPRWVRHRLGKAKRARLSFSQA
ncbi:hypothetical protein J3F83DRAFT_748771 [Trichoderma novae-zelandiae]